MTSASPSIDRSQILTAAIPTSPVMTRRPSGENAANSPDWVCCAERRYTWRPSTSTVPRVGCTSSSHTRAVPSLPPETMRRESGDQSTVFTTPVCPTSRSSSVPVAASQTRTDESAERPWRSIARPGSTRRRTRRWCAAGARRGGRRSGRRTPTRCPHPRSRRASRLPSGLRAVSTTNVSRPSNVRTIVPVAASATRTTPSSGHAAATSLPSASNDCPHAPVVPRTLAISLARVGIPDLQEPVVAGRREHRAVVRELDVVHVAVLVPDPRSDGLAGRRVAEIDRPRVLRALGHEDARWAPVEGPAEVLLGQHDP